MSSDGLQITIPTFEDDDDDFRSTPIPFWRPHNFGGFGQGHESPTITPIPLGESRERSQFHHSREDSAQSFESDLSLKYAALTNNNGKSFASAHSSQSSLVSSGPTKKASFASIRNAFKSSAKSDKSVESPIPPVPLIDAQAYPPALRNPFSRSQSALAHLPPQPPTASARRPSVTASPPQPQPRPPTPTRRPLKRGNHSFSGATSHSQSTSDGGDVSYVQQSPLARPPVPKMPLSRTAAGSSPQEAPDRVPSEPKTPAEYALHAVFTRFVTAAEMKIETFVKQTQDPEPRLSNFLGHGSDPMFDELLESFSKIAQKHAQPLVTSILRWRKTVGANAIKQQFVYEGPAHSRSLSRTPDAPAAERERRHLAAIYVMGRALIIIVRSMPKDALGHAMGTVLEEITFEQVRKPYTKQVSSINHLANADLFGTLLGHVSDARFESVSDRLILELKPIADGLVPKDHDSKYEGIVRNVKHLNLKVWPPEAFEEAADFLERFSRSFDHAHGQRLKVAFAETLALVLHPIGKTAQAEVNHPVWAKAIDVIFPKAKDMMSKPRYWHTAYPLVISALCVAPQEYFLRHWIWVFESGIPKLKERAHRPYVLNGVIRLLWTYLFRCREPISTVTARLENMLKHLFPLQRTVGGGGDESLEPLTVIVHYVLSRHLDMGGDLTMVLLQEQMLNEIHSQKGAMSDSLFPDRMIIAIQAVLLTLTNLEKEQYQPLWPSLPGQSGPGQDPDYQYAAGVLPEAVFNKPGTRDFFDRFAPMIAKIGSITARTVGAMSVLDEQWTPHRLAAQFEDSDSFIVRQQPEGLVAYPRSMQLWVQLFQTFFDALPRCLHSSTDLAEVLDQVIRGLVHVDPAVSESATLAMRRLASIKPNASLVVLKLTKFLFSSRSVTREGVGSRFAMECSRFSSLWANIIEAWLQDFASEDNGIILQDLDKYPSLIDEIQAASLFLLSWSNPVLRAMGYRTLRTAASNLPHSPRAAPSVLEVLDTPELIHQHLAELRWNLEGQDLSRLDAWMADTKPQMCLRIASSETDGSIWFSLFPSLLRNVMDHHPRSVSLCRDCTLSAILRYHPTVSSVAEIAGKGPLAQSSRNGQPHRETRDIGEHRVLINQWSIWTKLLCRTALANDGRVTKEHVRGSSDISSQRDRISSSKGLFRHIIPFLSSDHAIFRDSAVHALGSVDQSSYQSLLEDLKAITRHIYDDIRGKSNPKLTPSAVRSRRQDRLYTAVAYIYCLTSPFIQDCRSYADTTSLHLVLQFVRETQIFLNGPETRSDWELQPLRRHFCGIVQHLFSGLVALKDSDRFMPQHAWLRLYRLCEEWCLLGKQSDVAEQRHLAMRASVPRGWRGSQDKELALMHFEKETNRLSIAAATALTSLCEGAFYTADLPPSSPMSEPLQPLDMFSTLDRLNAMLSAPSPKVVESARECVRRLLMHPNLNNDLFDQVLQCSLLTPCANKARLRFFEIVAGVITSKSASHHFTFGQCVFLGLLNLNHGKAESRRLAFQLLEDLHSRYGGIIPLSQFEAAIGSCAPNVYLHAQRQLSDILAHEHRNQATSVIEQGTRLITQSSECSPLDLSDIVGNCLQLLEPWLADVDLMPENVSSLPVEGRTVLRSVVTLTAKYMDLHPEQIQALWARIVDEQYPMNSTSTVSFLMEQANESGDSQFVACATRIIACFSRTAVGKRAIEDLCSFIEPQNMVATIDSKDQQEADDVRWIQSLPFASSKDDRLQTLAPAQLAWMFLGDVAPERAWELSQQLPALLHALITHVDHRTPFIQQNARRLLFQVIRSWLPGMDELASRAAFPSRHVLSQGVGDLESQGETLFWTEEDPEQFVDEKMKALCENILRFLEPLLPSLRQEWGKLALDWGTSCPIRAIALRSLQAFRALMPPVDKPLMASLIGRLSNTIADEGDNIQSFGVELLVTIKAIASNPHLQIDLLPQLFWCACACLSTTVELEYLSALELLDTLLDRLDIGDSVTIAVLLEHKPPLWVGENVNLQSLVTQGLRSANTSDLAFHVLSRLAEVNANDIICPDGGRVRDIYAVSIVWCLHSMDQGAPDESLVKLATDLANLADSEKLPSISRILVSFSKSRFRTKDDFARQAIMSLREQFATREWTDVVTLLLSLTLNSQKWIREKAMQVLKVLFQQRDAHHPDEPLTSELLMPLLRLLQTDLAAQALEVLDVRMPMSVDNGPAAKDVIRMSMHENARAPPSSQLIFGVPKESGWCVSNPVKTRDTCRRNAMHVFDTCKTAVRPSVIQFEPDVQLQFREAYQGSDLDEGDSLGELVSTLHDINSFFQRDSMSLPRKLPPPSQEAEDRVADILSRSLAKDSPEWATDLSFIPPTPSTAAFNAGKSNGFESPILDFDQGSSESDNDDKFTFDRFVKPTNPPPRNGFLRRVRKPS